MAGKAATALAIRRRLQRLFWRTVALVVLLAALFVLLALFPFLEPGVPREVARLESDEVTVVATQIPNEPWDAFRIRLFSRPRGQTEWTQYFVAHDDPFSFWGTLVLDEDRSIVTLRVNGMVRAKLDLKHEITTVFYGSKPVIAASPVGRLPDPMADVAF